MARAPAALCVLALGCLAAGIQGATTDAGPQGAESAVLPRRFDFPDEMYGEPSGVFNPASVWHVAQGWVTMFRWDGCFYQTCGIHHTDTKPLLAVLGTDPAAPDLSLAVGNAFAWGPDNASYVRMLQENSADRVTGADWRPFVWQGEVYAGHWLKFGWSGAEVPQQHVCWSRGWGDLHSCEYTAISRLNFDSRTLELVYQFKKPILGSSYKPEKNWAFLEAEDGLDIIYTLMPCTIVFRFDPTHPSGARLLRSICYGDGMQILEQTGHELKSSRLSGNPVRWHNASSGQEELFGMVHSRAHQHSYSNWLLKLDPVTLRVTHMSAGPVLKSSGYHLGGYFKGVLVVGSFHIVTIDGQEVLRMLLGEGDQYSAWEDVPLDRILWHQLEAAAAEDATDKMLSLQFPHERPIARLNRRLAR